MWRAEPLLCPFYVFGSSVFFDVVGINYSFQFLFWILWPISFYVSRWNILNNDMRISVPLCTFAFETVSFLRLFVCHIL
jgi:hypothetical protein